MTAVVAVSCLVMAALEAITLLGFMPPVDGLRPIVSIASHAIAPWAPWLACAPLIALFGIKFRVRPERWLLAIGSHLPGCAIVVAAVVAAQIWVIPHIVRGEQPVVVLTGSMDGPSIGSPEPGAAGVLESDAPFIEIMTPSGAIGPGADMLAPIPSPISSRVGPSITTYVILVVIINAVLALRESRARDVEEARLRSELASAQLASLRMQINPHFLFNALNGVSALIGSDPARARRMLVHLSDLLRVSFADLERHETSLERELELAGCYIDIQCARFGDRLVVETKVEASARRAAVPVLCLQPLLENTVVHVVEKCDRPCAVTISATCIDDRVVIEVADDGPGAVGNGEPGSSGVGLSNTRARIASLYGGQGSLDIETRLGLGFRVRLSLPFREMPADVHGERE